MNDTVIMFISSVCLAVLLFLIALVFIHNDYKKSIKKIYKDDLWDALISDHLKIVPVRYGTANDCIEFDYAGRYDVFVWMNRDDHCNVPYASLHTKEYYFGVNSCLLSSFNRKKSEKLAEILLNENKDKIKKLELEDYKQRALLYQLID